MPELPEVEVLIRHLRPLVTGRRIQRAQVFRPRISRPTPPRTLSRTLVGSRILDLQRRGKYLVFSVRSGSHDFQMLGHLGMTGRMYLLKSQAPLPRHVAVVLDFGRERLVFEDTRYFGRFTLDLRPVEKLGPEPLNFTFTPAVLQAALAHSSQAIKIKLLDQTAVAGVGNIYASEALHRARVHPKTPANRLSPEQVRRLWSSIRKVLREAIRFGSTVPLSFAGVNGKENLFYYGQAPGTVDYYEERLRVYGRERKPCSQCSGNISRIVQAGRSTFFCRTCQKY